MADLGHGSRRAAAYVDRKVFQDIAGGNDPVIVQAVFIPQQDFVRRDTSQPGNALALNLFHGHLQRNKQHGAGRLSDAVRNLQGKRGLAHARTGRKHVQAGPQHTLPQHTVQRLEASRHRAFAVQDPFPVLEERFPGVRR